MIRINLQMSDKLHKKGNIASDTIQLHLQIRFSLIHKLTFKTQFVIQNICSFLLYVFIQNPKVWTCFTYCDSF